MLRAIPLLLLAGCGLSACGPSAPPPEQTVFDTQVRSLDRAREVQGVMDQHAAELGTRLEDEAGRRKP